MTCKDHKDCELFKEDPPVRDVLKEIRDQGTAGPSMTGEAAPKITPVRTIDSFFSGAPPRGVDYLVSSENILVTQPLVANNRQNISFFPVPESMVLDVSYLEFFMLAPVGGGWTRMPDDFAQESFSFEIWQDGRAPLYAVINSPGLAQDIPGFDTLNQNVLAYFGDTPGHLIYASGSVLEVNVVTRNAAIVVPAVLRAGVRICGTQIPKEQWELSTR